MAQFFIHCSSVCRAKRLAERNFCRPLLTNVGKFLCPTAARSTPPFVDVSFVRISRTVFAQLAAAGHRWCPSDRVLRSVRDTGFLLKSDSLDRVLPADSRLFLVNSALDGGSSVGNTSKTTQSVEQSTGIGSISPRIVRLVRSCLPDQPGNDLRE